MVARLLELVGIRQMHLLMSWLTGDTPLPAVGKPSPWSRQKLVDNRDGSRYFGIANFLRGSLYWWPLFCLWQFGLIWLDALIIFILFYHYSSVLLEIYKILRVNALLPNAPEQGEDPGPNRSSPRWDWWFAPKKWETEKFYKAIGIIALKIIVTTYVDKTKLTVEEQLAGKKAEYLPSRSKTESLQFEFATRVGEGLHSFAILLNVPVVFNLFWFHQLIPGILIGLLTLSDVMLALLQRCHRLRVWRLVVKMRSRT
jgi:hypothetical protein